MIIQDIKTLMEVQKEFSQKFPFLKIKFYAGTHQAGETSPMQQKLDSQLTIGEARTIHDEGDLSINANQKISTLEQNFMEKFGLNVQVFRKSGNLWLQTSKTDHWTLAEANRKGEHSSIAYEEKYS